MIDTKPHSPATRPLMSTKPRKVARSKSFGDRVRGTIKRSLSFGSTPRGKSMRDIKEANIFGSDIVSSEFIQKSINQVDEDVRVQKLEIEDLVTSETHQKMLSSIKELILSREWESVKFVDYVNDLDSYLLWRQQIEALMQDYEDYEDSDKSKAGKICTFEACYLFQAGTKLSELLQFLTEIHFNDQSICGIEYGGYLTGCGSYKCVTNALKACISRPEMCLTESVSLRIICGWSEATLQWKMSLAQSLRFVQKACKGAKKSKASIGYQALFSDVSSVSSSSADGIIANACSICIHRGEAPDYDWKAGRFTGHRTILSQLQ